MAVSTTPATGSFVTDAKGQVVIAQVPAGTVSVAARRRHLRRYRWTTPPLPTAKPNRWCCY
ncbi:MAG: hypothetical protein WKG07_24170 [Hymenobacter sp.]